MTDKIREETIVLLDVLDAKRNGTQLPPKTKAWIEKHGMPKEEEVAERQSSVLPASPKNQSSNYERQHELVKKTVRKYGARSQKAIQAYREAHSHHISFDRLKDWSGLTRRQMYNLVSPDPEYLHIQQLIELGYTMKSRRMILYLKHLHQQGKSLSKIKTWSGISVNVLRKEFAEVSTQYQAEIVWRVPIPSNVSNDKKKEMLAGKLKPSMPIDPVKMMGHVRLYMDKMHLTGEVLLKCRSKYSLKEGFDINMTPLY